MMLVLLSSNEFLRTARKFENKPDIDTTEKPDPIKPCIKQFPRFIMITKLRMRNNIYFDFYIYVDGTDDDNSAGILWFSNSLRRRGKSNTINFQFHPRIYLLPCVFDRSYSLLEKIYPRYENTERNEKQEKWLHLEKINKLTFSSFPCIFFVPLRTSFSSRWYFNLVFFLLKSANTNIDGVANVLHKNRRHDPYQSSAENDL